MFLQVKWNNVITTTPPFLTGLKDVGLLLESGNDPFDGGLEVFVDDWGWQLPGSDQSWNEGAGNTN